MIRDLLKLCQILNTKICHDLSGMIGTINSCLSLGNNEELIQNQNRELLHLSTERLVNYLKFYRYIYSISADKEITDLKIFKELVNNFFKEHTINISFDFSDENKVLKEKIAKVFMCIIFTIAKAFYKNANLDIIIKDIGNGYLMKITTIKGKLNTEVLKLSTYLDSNRSSGKVNLNKLDYDNVHEIFTRFLIEEIGYKLTTTQLDNSIECYLHQ